MKKNNPRLVFWVGIIGNVLDHYDVALYAFMAQFISPIFFAETTDKVVALILTYSLMSTSIVTRPIGAFVFGKMAMNYGPKRVLVITLIGMSISTLLVGLTPGYDTIGPMAPLVLMLARMLQGIFASGEGTVSSLFIMEHVKVGNYSKASSYYLVSTMGGMMVASWAATCVSTTSDPSYYWRYPFFGAILTGFIGVFLRSLLKDLPVEVPEKRVTSMDLIRVNSGKLIRIIIVSSFSYMTYAIPFIFMNNFVPMLHPSISSTEMLAHNSMLLMFDIVLLIIAGFISEKFEYNKWMATMSFILFLTSIPLFWLLSSASITIIVLVRIWFIFIGVLFVAPLKAWFFKMLSGNEKYLVLGIGYSIGAELLGRSTTPLCLFLWRHFEHLLAPAIYVAILSLAATIALTYKSERLP
ncbi:MAG: MFS transporter [Rickettsiaceae bacterium]|nr:MFS transporter [Rickettsiaceae bacterium]